MPKKKTPQKQTFSKKVQTIPKRIVLTVRKKADNYLARRPHRSFRRTRRRDYNRSLDLPGYFAFTAYVRKTLWGKRKLFLSMALVYAVLTGTLVGLASQETYSLLTSTIRDTSGGLFSGDWGKVCQAGLLFVATVTGGITASLSEVQQLYAGLIGLLTWLTTVWLLRSVLAGHKVKLRDGLYNAGAPILSTVLVGVVLVIQLLPVALAFIAYSAAASTGLLDGGVEAMLFWISAGLLGLLSLYWITSTFMALVIVTLPGMYPIQALTTAGDLVVGRRVRILLRILWLLAGIAIMWVAVMIPIILFDTWLKSVWTAIEWVPIVPVILLVLSSLTVVWAASYIYLLYRKVVADDTAPA